MKKFAKFLFVALAAAVIVSMFSVVASATEESALGTDPNNLKPGSESVIFIKDAPRDKDHKIVGKLEGDGSGSDENNPFIPMDHEKFDPSATSPKNYLQTAFYQATELLKDEGGTIVVCGPVYFGLDESYGDPGVSTKDVWTANYGKNTIKFTSVYNGVDYRKTAGAKIIIDTPAEVGIFGQSIWENIDIVTAGTNRILYFNYFATLVGEGVNCYPEDEAYEGAAPNYISLAGGHRYAGGVDYTTNFVVKSGTYNSIVAGMWGVNNQRKLKEDGSISWTNNLEGNTVTNLVIEGTTTVYGEIYGTNRRGADFSGNATVIINGGNYECDFFMVGKSGMLNKDGTVTLKINGGNFAKTWSINNAIDGITNNMPAASILDFSDWKGELSDLANAYGAVTEFSEIKFPAGVTGDQVLAAATEAPATEAPATEAPATDATATQAPTVEETKASETQKEEKDTTPSDSGDPVVDDEGKSEGGNITLIIIVIVAVVAVIGVVVVIVVRKKKKA